MNKFSISIFTLAACMLAGCKPSATRLTVRRQESPTSRASLVPQVGRLGPEDLVLSWERPLPRGGYAFEMAVQKRERWSDVRTIAQGPALSMFTADLPGVAALTDRSLLAMWEVKDERDGDRYATNIKTARSQDEGRTWVPSATPYGPGFAGQHSFLSWFEAGDGLGLLWLDASARSAVRHAHMQMPENQDQRNKGSVGLRFAALNANGNLDYEQFVNPIVCECCPTSAAVTQRGAVVVYRGREETPGTLPSQVKDDRPTVRDIYIARREGEQWRKPRLVHKDNWVINGCPDNGPAVDAFATNVAVAWWTRSNGEPKVQLAFSSDAGDSFSAPFRIDLGKGEGQVTLALLADGHSAVVGWLEEGQVWARCVSDASAMSQAVALGSSPHHSRLPRWLSNADGSVTAVWTSTQGSLPQVQISRIYVQSAK